MTKRVLVTGGAGFLGRHTCAYLSNLNEDLEIICTDSFKVNHIYYNKFICADLSCAEKVGGLIEETYPDYIIHLAGTFGNKDSEEIYRVNVFSMAALMEAVRQRVPHVIVVATGSAAEYGRISEDQLPVNEQIPCLPVTLYGLSKFLATQIAMYYHRVHNLCTMIVRPFQLVGKGVPSCLAPGAFAKQLRQVIAEGSNIIRVGNLESSRDFLDVHDTVEAIWLLCKKPASGEIFNLCSGQATKMADLLNRMIKCAGVDVKPEIDPARLRGSSDVSQIYGTFEKLQNHCGWSPKITLDKSIAEMFT